MGREQVSIDQIYVVYGYYITTNGDEIEHNSVGVFEDYEDAMDYGIKLIKKFSVSDYEICATKIRSKLTNNL